MAEKIFVLTDSVPEEEYERIGFVTSQACRGIGLWTSICLGFANIFGTACNHIAYKIERAKTEVINDMVVEAEERGACGIVELKLSLSGLSVIGAGTLVKKRVAK